MEQRAIRYNGKGFALRGEKNRLALPISLRKDVLISSDGEKRLCIARHHAWDCLIGFGLSRIDNFDSWLDKEQQRHTELGRDFDRDAAAMLLYGYEEVPFDTSGRFVLDDDWAEIGSIEGEVFFHGAGEFFTMWNPTVLERMEGPAFEAAKIVCRRQRATSGKGARK